MSKYVRRLLVGAGGAALLISIGYKITMSYRPFPKHLLGPAKSDQTLAEMQAHPIWLWGMQVNDSEDADGAIGGDETAMRAWLGSPNVTREMMSPEILLRVKGTNLWAVGLYDSDLKTVDALGVFGSDGRRPPGWYINTPGTPITYVAVPSIEGLRNVEFIAKNRRRSQALMVGQFTPAEAEQRYEEEVAKNEASANAPGTLIRKEPELLQLAVCFLQRVAQDVFAGTNGLVFTDVAGCLEDEDPTLFQRLLKEATTPQVAFHRIGELGSIVGGGPKENGIFLILTDWRRDGDVYAVSGYWTRSAERRENVEHRLTRVGGNWVVKD